MAKRKDLEARARQVGLFLDTWSPGDGVTRYRFSRDDLGYFGCEPAYTALGAKEADTWLSGYCQGWYAKPGN